MSATVDEMSDRVAHAHQVGRVLQVLGWCVAAVGILGAIVFAGFWITGDLSSEQAISLILGTMLATVLSGATAYGSGVNIGLGADRLALALSAPPRAAAEGEQPAEGDPPAEGRPVDG